jgi:hypothetical protein
MDAVRNGHIYEIKSSYILQPGPAALTEGVRQIHGLLARVADGAAAGNGAAAIESLNETAAAQNSIES